MKILWVKSDFLHPARGGGQIRTLETLKRLRQRHEIHFAALDLPQPGFGLQRTSEYCTKAYAVSHPVPRKSGPRYWAELAACHLPSRYGRIGLCAIPVLARTPN